MAWFSRTHKSGRQFARSPFRFRPRLEMLEDRLTPSVTVTTTADELNGADGALSLREAINLVNAGSVADNTITLPAGLYKITIAGAGEDNNATGDFDIKHALILKGVGAGSSVVDGNGLDRVFDVGAGAADAVNIQDITVQGGIIVGSFGYGGGIQFVSGASLTLVGDLVQNNQASGYGGGIGGSANPGTLNINNSTITGNFSLITGGGVEIDRGNITISGSTISNNRQILPGGNGGGGVALGLSGAGNLMVTNSTISGNLAFGIGSGGGGILNLNGGNVVLTGDILSNNIAFRSGGGCALYGSATLTVTNTLFLGNTAQDGDGGAIDVITTGDVTITTSELTLNSAGKKGGALSDAGANKLTISASTFNHNIATDGGGLELETTAASTLTNVTISGNLAGLGGGIDKVNDGVITLTNDTIVLNRADGGGGLYSQGASLTLNNTIVARNIVSDEVDNNGVAANLVDGGHNLIGDNTGAPSSFTAGSPNTQGSYVGTSAAPISPGIAALADNGGSSRLPDGTHLLTHALVPGSLALAHGMVTGEPATDERGVPRPTDTASAVPGRPDIGAFQYVKVAFAISDTDLQIRRNLFGLNGKAQTTWDVVAPGHFKAIATATFGADGDIMLFGLGMDNQLYGARIKSDGNLLFGFFLVAPGQFKTLVADTIGTPGAGSFPELFGVGLDNQVYAARLGAQGTLVNGFFLVAPGQFQSIAAGQFGAGNPELFGIGLDKQIYAARFDPNGLFLNGFFLVAPGQFTSAAVTSRDNGGADLFGVGADQKLYLAVLDANGGLSAGFSQVNTGTPGTILAVDAVNLGAGTLGVYALGTDRQIYAGACSSSTGLPTSAPALVAPGQFSSFSVAANPLNRGLLLGIGFASKTIFGALFSPTNALLDGFFTTAPGTFNQVVVAP